MYAPAISRQFIAPLAVIRKTSGTGTCQDARYIVDYDAAGMLIASCFQFNASESKRSNQSVRIKAFESKVSIRIAQKLATFSATFFISLTIRVDPLNGFHIQILFVCKRAQPRQTSTWNALDTGRVSTHASIRRWLIAQVSAESESNTFRSSQTCCFQSIRFVARSPS